MPRLSSAHPNKSPPRKVFDSLDAVRWQEAIQQAGILSASEITYATRIDVARLLCRLGEGLSAIHEPFRRRLEELLGSLAGKSFGSLQANQTFARDVQTLLTRLGLRIACPKEGCGQPASLRCAAAGNSKHGVFQFDHSEGGRRTTHKGSTALPQLILIPAPPDRRRASAPSTAF